ncbi:uncharacterized protein NMK_1887 [Novimethylophilus kurashikiensis]|uniref:Uncharacterized protein n=1 Tax=Novimethylophilus kurashikiensis TaxID=1825523 RepID=A0A2R5F903_9PROT|nr:hypothetical protein [Novimethylophilus kurashikiensis]GBG14299.1 uncharacterized protein NMK_1887 [Novimethylophilus kurashikiensis]
MKTALEKKFQGYWIPIAIRNQRLTSQERQALDSGDTIEKDGTHLRRVDWATRKALQHALKR